MDVKHDNEEFLAGHFLSKRLSGHVQDYVSKYNGGSIRHAGLRVIDVMGILDDFRRDAERAVQEAYDLGKLDAKKKRKIEYGKGGAPRL